MRKVIIILSVALLLRLVGINWDQGFHMHPDERALMMVADQIHFFDKLNPHFFNYGTLPIYILKGIGQLIDTVFFTHFSRYGEMLYLGRFLSMLADLGTVFLIYKIALLIFRKENIALAASFFYSIAFFPIQNAHFFIVDTFLTLFVTHLLYRTLLYLQKPTLRNLVFLGVSFTACVTTKFTAILFAPLLLFLVVVKTKQKFLHSILFTFSFLVFTFLFMPYAFLDYQKFFSDVSLQFKLNSNPYTFPYTLQYVGTVPYWYYLKNIFLWGFGPVLSILSLLGLYFVIRWVAERRSEGSTHLVLLILLVFYGWYFLVIGRSAVKFMRYMLPLYPFFAMLAGYGLYKIRNSKFEIRNSHGKLVKVILVLSVLWMGLFLSIYTKEHTRIAATKWIVKSVPRGSTIAVEHWDDRLPLTRQELFSFEELPLYERPDDERKWRDIRKKLKRTDYIVISSNRLYVPLMRLDDCKKYLICYPKTKKYYEDLFAGRLGFQKLTEFTSYPQFQISNFKFQIPDDTADESFTVYDHTKVLIFKKTKGIF